jgi:hypothetical protein
LSMAIKRRKAAGVEGLVATTFPRYCGGSPSPAPRSQLHRTGELRSFRMGNRRLVSTEALADHIRAREAVEG